MTKKLTFTGYSDDLFCVSINDQPHEEIDCFGKKAAYILESESGTLLVIGEYVNPGVWVIGVAPVDDGVQIPHWNTSITHGHDYSPALSIECPDDVKVDDFYNIDDD